MEFKQNGELKLNGAGSASGGTFKVVEINGAGQINGDIQCRDFTINGAGDITGNIEAAYGRINGSGKIRGNITADEFRVSGSANITGNFNGKEILIEGATDLKGNVSCEEVKIRGALKVSGDCNAEIFDAKGAFSVRGLLNAGNIFVNLYGKCEAKEIGGEKITVKRGRGFRITRYFKSLFLSLDLFSLSLHVDVIEGDDIYLEDTIAKVVRGNNVTLGPGCEIDLVEYRNEYQQDPQAKVKENKQV